MNAPRLILILIVSLALAFAVAAVAWAASKGHVLLFPLVLVFGFPLIPLLRHRK